MTRTRLERRSCQHPSTHIIVNVFEDRVRCAIIIISDWRSDQKHDGRGLYHALLLPSDHHKQIHFCHSVLTLPRPRSAAHQLVNVGLETKPHAQHNSCRRIWILYWVFWRRFVPQQFSISMPVETGIPVQFVPQFHLVGPSHQL